MLEIVDWLDRKERPKCGQLDAIIKPLALSPALDIHTVWEGELGDRHNMILGHEGCGVVEEVGELVKDFKVATAMAAAITPDWSSRSSGGIPMHSGGISWKFSNFKRRCIREYFHVNDADGNSHICQRLFLQKKLVCYLTYSYWIPLVLSLVDIQFGDTVLVNGINLLGLMSAAGAKPMGASIIICGTRPRLQEAAKKYGATILSAARKDHWFLNQLEARSR